MRKDTNGKGCPHYLYNSVGNISYILVQSYCQTTRSMCALTIGPHVGGRYDGKEKQEHDEDKRLQVVSRHPLHSKEDGPQ